VKKSQASIPCAWARRNSLQEGPPRRGAGPSPERRSSDLIVVAPTRMPSLRSSPWIRTQPQLGSSRPSRSTSSRSCDRSAGGPAASAVCPLLGDQLTVPAHERLRRHQQRRPALPRQNAAQGSEQHPLPTPQRQALHPSCAAPPAGDEAPRSPIPARPPTSRRRTLAGTCEQPRASGKEPPDRTDRPA
jgi:hypothetical protein